MSDSIRISELFAEIVSWAVRNGAEHVDRLPAPWEGETDQWRVRINATGQEVDNIPHLHAFLEHKVYLQMCLVAPNGGTVIGVNEADLIGHFKSAQVIA